MLNVLDLVQTQGMEILMLPPGDSTLTVLQEMPSRMQEIMPRCQNW